MFKFLKDELICPFCHNELSWNIILEDQTKIIDADIMCTNCSRIYSVKNQVADFLIENKVENDLWQTGEDYFDKYFRENPEIKARLMTVQLDELSPADMYVKANILRKCDNQKEADELDAIAVKKAYTPEMQEALGKQFQYLIKLLMEKNQFVLDIASGSCTLVKHILKNTDLKVVASDFSKNIIRKTLSSLHMEGFEERISFMVFDAHKTPFRNNSIPVLTTFSGLQNLDNPGNILSELKRISVKEFYSICSLCSEYDEVNRAALRESGVEAMWVKESHKQAFVDSGWNVEVLNSIFAKSSPTPMGKILNGVGIDGFPVADGLFEHCIVKATI